jgi:hypothetical protein
MPGFRFGVIVAAGPMSHDEILDATDALGSAGCTDASIRGHVDGLEFLFERSADSLQAAITSAIANVENAGFSGRAGRNGTGSDPHLNADAAV